MLCTVSWIALSRSLRRLLKILHLVSHLEPVVADSLHVRVHHLLLLWQLEGALGHTHLSWVTLGHHLHLLIMHLHIHALNLDHTTHFRR